MSKNFFSLEADCASGNKAKPMGISVNKETFLATFVLDIGHLDHCTELV